MTSLEGPSRSSVYSLAVRDRFFCFLFFLCFIVVGYYCDFLLMCLYHLSGRVRHLLVFSLFYHYFKGFCYYFCTVDTMTYTVAIACIFLSVIMTTTTTAIVATDIIYHWYWN